MFKRLLNTITDNGPGRETGSEASPASSFVDQEEQHSAEGFLCPLCMTAFPSPETLELHYQKTHDDSNKASGPPHSNGDIGDLRQEILELQSSLADERNSSEELKKEVLKMQADIHSKDEMDNASLKSQEKEFDGAKTLLISEVTLLRQQLAAELEHVSQLRKEKEILGDKLLSITADNDKKSQEIASMEVQLSHKNTIDDAALLRQELVSVQKMMDQMTLERESQLAELQIKFEEIEKELKEKDSNFDAKMKETILGYDVKLKEYATQIDKMNNEQKLAQSNIVTKEKQLVEELNSAKIQLSGAENFRVAAEIECAELKAEIQRLQGQHSELYSKIEGGEGAQAALDSFRKENETLQQNLSSSQTQNKELTKNLYNLKLEVDKIREESTSQSEVYKVEKIEWNTKYTLCVDQLREKDEVVKQTTEKCEHLEKFIQTKDNEMKILRGEYEKGKAKIENLIESLESLRLAENELSRKSSELETKIKKADESARCRTQELNSLKIELNKFNALCEEKDKAAEETAKALKNSEVSIERVEQDLLYVNSLLEECKMDAKSQINSMESKLEAAAVAHSLISEKLIVSEKACEDLKIKLEKETQRQDEIQRGKAVEIENLKRVVSETKVELSKSEAKIQQLQIQTDEVLRDKIELENKFRLSEEGKSLLLERCLSGENESDRLQEIINELRRKLEDSNSALQELGRENQSWQMESAKAQGRKWTDDAIVTNCTSCSKEFTLTIRKHHCRHCGQIFCNECSCRSASVPSCKKPARVCDTCFDELTSK